MNGRKVHFMGIGGVGMAGLAVLLKARGAEVDGCDAHPSRRVEWLRAQGIPVAAGHDPAHVRDADELVVTPAVPATSPELLAARRVRRRGEVLAGLVSSHPDSIAVCGSHGKTTTATWTARLLLALGEDVAWAIGGETGGFPVASPGKGPDAALVVEADESDGTLALYRAGILVVTNCEYDHPDHFPTREAYVACYDAARRGAREVVESGEAYPEVSALAPVARAVEGLAEHNRMNACAAAAVALRRGHPAEAVGAALAEVVRELPDRRFQKVADGVYTDYAHHPTEMACAVRMARQICRGRLRVLFQPHRYSRTRALLKDFPAAFDGADEVVLCPTYAAFEEPVEGGDVADLYREARERGVKGLFLARSCGEAWEHARNSRREGDVTLLLGAGDIVELVPRIRRETSGAALPPRRRTWIGAGTNTWRSDLATDDDYVATDGPASAPGASLGIPWMAGIPGTVGGWIKMNAGAFGHSISEVVEAVKVDGRWIPAAECGFGYRRSSIDGEIQDVRFAGLDKIPASPTAADYLAKRAKFPPGTKGSVFKNPEGDFAGRLLEAAGAKGMRVGGAYVWERHANVIVSGDGARPCDFLALARLMRNRVRAAFGVELEYEVRGLA